MPGVIRTVAMLSVGKEGLPPLVLDYHSPSSLGIALLNSSVPGFATKSVGKRSFPT